MFQKLCLILLKRRKACARLYLKNTSCIIKTSNNDLVLIESYNHLGNTFL